MTGLEHWRKTTLGEECEIVSGSTPKTGEPSFWGGDIPWLTPADLSKWKGTYIDGGARYITQAGLDSCSARIFPKNTVMMSSRAPIGYTAIANREMCTNQGFKSMLPSATVNPEWLRYFLGHALPEIKAMASGTTFAEISGKKLGTLTMNLPPLGEQKRIVEVLDDHLSRLDKALAETEYSNKAARRFSSSLLHAMFSGDLMKDELGIQDVNSVELGTVAEIQSGGTPKGVDRLTSEAESETHNVPFYKVGDMNRDARYMKSSRSYLTETDVDSLRLKVIPAGSVIFPKAGGAIATDKKRLVQVPGPIDLNCMAVIPGVEMLPSYLAWFFDSFKLSDLSNGSILPQIGKTAVMQVRLPCPSLSEQEAVVQYLEENISMVRAQVQSIEGIASSIANLRRSILNDAFSGRLVDRGSSEQ